MQFCSHALRGNFTWRAAPLMDAARPDSVPTQRVGTKLHRNDGFSNVFMSCPLVCYAPRILVPRLSIRPTLQDNL